MIRFEVYDLTNPVEVLHVAPSYGCACDWADARNRPTGIRRERPHSLAGSGAAKGAGEMPAPEAYLLAVLRAEWARAARFRMT